MANLLEGSVQRAADSVHINVQLIRAATDEHLWAETYNRKLDDIFGVEAEVASTIADQLNAKLSGVEKEEVTRKPTNDPDAYDAYLRGLAFEGRIDDLMGSTFHAIEAFSAAVKSDPNFALAWAHLAREHSFFFIGADQSPARKELARKALETAMKLQPNLAEAQLADGFYITGSNATTPRRRNVSKPSAGNIRIIPVRLTHWQRSRDVKVAGRIAALCSRKRSISTRRTTSSLAMPPWI